MTEEREPAEPNDEETGLVGRVADFVADRSADVVVA